ncbi:MAG TPA: hypothetical protein VFX02_13065 [Gammaproteobacteria bacterium]|nr:hypothetical protein [Gammaproteobacteria bacterium]
MKVELESLSGQSSFSPFVGRNDAAASGGQAIEWPNNGSNQNFGTPSDTSSGQVLITFSLSQISSVRFDMLANLAGADNDSFHYKLDGGAWAVQNNVSTNGYGTITPATFSSLAAGVHTLRISRREDGAKLDRVTLTASAGTISSR